MLPPYAIYILTIGMRMLASDYLYLWLGLAFKFLFLFKKMYLQSLRN